MKEDISDNKLLNTMLETFKSVDKIVLLKEEDNVIRQAIRGVSRVKILEELREKYPDKNITVNDLNKFLLSYRDVLEKESVDLQKGYVRRLIKSKTGLNNELIDLALQAKHMAQKFEDEGDNSNAVAAVRTAANVFMQFAKAQGLINDTPEVNINMQMDKLVQNIANDNNVLSENLQKIIEIDAEEVVDGKKTK